MFVYFTDEFESTYLHGLGLWQNFFQYRPFLSPVRSILMHFKHEYRDDASGFRLYTYFLFFTAYIYTNECIYLFLLLIVVTHQRIGVL